MQINVGKYKITRKIQKSFSITVFCYHLDYLHNINDSKYITKIKAFAHILTMQKNIMRS